MPRTGDYALGTPTSHHGFPVLSRPKDTWSTLLPEDGTCCYDTDLNLIESKIGCRLISASMAFCSYWTVFSHQQLC